MYEFLIQGDFEAAEQAAQEDPHLVNQKNEAGLPPLYTALYGNRDAIDLLLGQGAELDIFAERH